MKKIVLFLSIVLLNAIGLIAEPIKVTVANGQLLVQKGKKEFVTPVSDSSILTRVRMWRGTDDLDYDAKPGENEKVIKLPPDGKQRLLPQEEWAKLVREWEQIRKEIDFKIEFPSATKESNYVYVIDEIKDSYTILRSPDVNNKHRLYVTNEHFVHPPPSQEFTLGKMGGKMVPIIKIGDREYAIIPILR